MDAALIVATVALVVAVVAAKVAVSSALQMIWGKPDIEVIIETRDVNNGTSLFFSLRNKPITNHFLRAMGVYRRQADNPFFSFNIRDIETNVIKAQVRKQDLKISQSWEDFEVIHIDNNGHAEITEKDGQILVPGKYYLELSIRADDYDKKYCAQFAVGEKSNQLGWLLETFTVVKNGNG